MTLKDLLSVQQKVWVEVPFHHRREDMEVVPEDVPRNCKGVKVVVGMKRGMGLRSTHGTSSQPRPHHEDRCGHHHTRHGLGCSAFGHGTRTPFCWPVSHRSESLWGQERP